MVKLLLIALGGGIGAVLRYLVSGWGQRLGPELFPLGTLLVNTAGCFLIGFLTLTLTGPVLISQNLRVALLVGVLGGFTTYSTFGFETFELIADGQYVLAAVNILASLLCGLIAVWFGIRLAEALFGAPAL